MSIKRIGFFLPLLLPMLAASPAKALTINVNDITAGGADATALAAFNQAAGLWESVFTDPVSVNIDFDFAPLGAGILGGTGSNTIGATVSNTVAALAADATSAADAVAVANLPANPTIDFRTNDAVTSAIFLDNNGTGNNAFLDINRANAKALGLLAGNDAGTDATITFSSTFGFDFDAGDGIGAGLFDFVGVAAHEIGHALGFVSGVDIVDLTHGAGLFAPVNLDPFRVFSVLDLYRYSAESLALGAGVFDFATGSHAGDVFFSLDGGATSLGTFETGSFNGTGRQASHWRDNLGQGIMDPTFAPQEFGVITGLDVLAFDAMGWDVVGVPEPSSVALVILGLAGLILRRRKL